MVGVAFRVWCWWLIYFVASVCLIGLVFVVCCLWIVGLVCCFGFVSFGFGLMLCVCGGCWLWLINSVGHLSGYCVLLCLYVCLY